MNAQEIGSKPCVIKLACAGGIAEITLAITTSAKVYSQSSYTRFCQKLRKFDIEAEFSTLVPPTAMAEENSRNLRFSQWKVKDAKEFLISREEGDRLTIFVWRNH